MIEDKYKNVDTERAVPFVYVFLSSLNYLGSINFEGPIWHFKFFSYLEPIVLRIKLIGKTIINSAFCSFICTFAGNI